MRWRYRSSSIRWGSEPSRFLGEIPHNRSPPRCTRPGLRSPPRRLRMAQIRSRSQDDHALRHRVSHRGQSSRRGTGAVGGRALATQALGASVERLSAWSAYASAHREPFKVHAPTVAVRFGRSTASCTDGGRAFVGECVARPGPGCLPRDCPKANVFGHPSILYPEYSLIPSRTAWNMRTLILDGNPAIPPHLCLPARIKRWSDH